MQRGASSIGVVANSRQVLSSAMAGWFLSSSATTGGASSSMVRASSANVSSSVVSVISSAILDLLTNDLFRLRFFPQASCNSLNFKIKKKLFSLIRPGHL